MSCDVDQTQAEIGQRPLVSPSKVASRLAAAVCWDSSTKGVMTYPCRPSRSFFLKNSHHCRAFHRRPDRYALFAGLADSRAKSIHRDRRTASVRSSAGWRGGHHQIMRVESGVFQHRPLRTPNLCCSSITTGELGKRYVFLDDGLVPTTMSTSPAAICCKSVLRWAWQSARQLRAADTLRPAVYPT